MWADAVFGPVADLATQWLNVYSNWVRALPVSFAFGAGMVATVNPCGFVMLPSFVAFYLAGEGQAQTSTVHRSWRATQLGVLVATAFILTFAAVGAVITLFGRQLMAWTYWAGLGVGLLMVTLGAVQFVTGRAIFADLTSGIRVQRQRSVSGVLAFGLAYAVASLGCTLPIFMLVVGSVFTGDGDYASSVWRFVEYGAGMGVVLGLVALAVALTSGWLMRVAWAVMPMVTRLANLALVFAGGYLLWYYADILG
jgi:cytochrome c biogenesis protein CcdA